MSTLLNFKRYVYVDFNKEVFHEIVYYIGQYCEYNYGK